MDANSGEPWSRDMAHGNLSSAARFVGRYAGRASGKMVCYGSLRRGRRPSHRTHRAATALSRDTWLRSCSRPRSSSPFANPPGLIYASEHLILLASLEPRSGPE
jgi:hypothetical protein